MTKPWFWVYTDVTSSYCWKNCIFNHWTPIVISVEYLDRNNFYLIEMLSITMGYLACLQSIIALRLNMLAPLFIGVDRQQHYYRMYAMQNAFQSASKRSQQVNIYWTSHVWKHIRYTRKSLMEFNSLMGKESIDGILKKERAARSPFGRFKLFFSKWQRLQTIRQPSKLKSYWTCKMCQELRIKKYTSSVTIAESRYHGNINS